GVGAEREESVRRAQRLVGRRGLVSRSQGPGDLAGSEVPAGFPDGQRDARLEQGDVDELPAAGALSRAQGGQGRDRSVERAGEVGDRDAHLDGLLPAFLSGDGHEAAHPLRHDVQPRALGIRPVLPPPRGRDVDEARVQLRQARVVELQVLHRARAQVLDQDVAPPRQLAEHLLALRSLEIERQRSLVAVQPEERRGLAADERTARASLVAAVGVLDLDDVRPQVRELEGAERGSHEVAHLEHADPRERSLAHRNGTSAADLYSRACPCPAKKRCAWSERHTTGPGRSASASRQRWWTKAACSWRLRAWTARRPSPPRSPSPRRWERPSGTGTAPRWRRSTRSGRGSSTRWLSWSASRSCRVWARR